MTWVYADSSAVERFRYDKAAETLVIQFKKGTVYQYFLVPYPVFAAFVSHVKSGGSAGQYFNEAIKDCYQYVQV